MAVRTRKSSGSCRRRARAVSQSLCGGRLLAEAAKLARRRSWPVAIGNDRTFFFTMQTPNSPLRFSPREQGEFVASWGEKTTWPSRPRS